MLRYYNIDFRFALWGKGEESPHNPRGYVGMRRLLNLIEQLPRDSAFRRATDADLSEWSPEADLLHITARLLDQSNRQIAEWASKGKVRPEPIEIPHPMDKYRSKQPRKQASHEEIMAFFGGDLRSDA